MTHAETRARIERLVKEWRKILDLEGWQIEIRFDEHVNKGTCAAMPIYEEATLCFNLHRIRKEARTYHALRELVVHELVHCMIWRNSERAVTQVARAILRARGLKY